MWPVLSSRPGLCPEWDGNILLMLHSSNKRCNVCRYLLNSPPGITEQLSPFKQHFFISKRSLKIQLIYYFLNGAQQNLLWSSQKVQDIWKVTSRFTLSIFFSSVMLCSKQHFKEFWTSQDLVVILILPSWHYEGLFDLGFLAAKTWNWYLGIILLLELAGKNMISSLTGFIQLKYGILLWIFSWSQASHRYGFRYIEEFKQMWK